ncbi:MAG TPA: hypothetical protein VD966_03900, partial [Pyrinomonadaceae bacterium]|nr:hypothetical protein [Pyrinomonadaceae bacterium]
MATEQFDVTIIGSGPGGYVAAQRAQGARTVARDELVCQLEVRQLARAPDERLDQLGCDAPAGQRSGRELVQFVGDLTDAGADEADE